MGSLGQRMAVRAVRGGDDVTLLQRAANPNGNCLLTDRHVEEPGQLARAEALLDLLLEAPNEQHLAEELPQQLGRAPFLSTLATGASVVATKIGACRSRSSTESSSRACPRSGPTRGSS